MRNSIIFLLAIFFFCSCSTSGYHAGTKQDDFNGYTTNWMDRNSIESTEVPMFCFNLIKHYSPGKEEIYRIWIKLALMNDWIFIDNGESLILLVDGERIGFYGEGSTKNRSTTTLSDTYVNEDAYYDVPLNQLQKIANAKTVRIQVVGSHGIKEGSLTQNNLFNIRRFLREYASK